MGKVTVRKVEDEVEYRSFYNMQSIPLGGIEAY